MISNVYNFALVCTYLIIAVILADIVILIFREN